MSTDINEAIARARESVPEDYYVKLSMGKDSVQVVLYGPEGRLTEFDEAEVDLAFTDEGRYACLGDAIERAVAFAIEHSAHHPIAREEDGEEPVQPDEGKTP